MKKIMSLLILSILIILTLAGCTTGDNTTAVIANGNKSSLKGGWEVPEITQEMLSSAPEEPIGEAGVFEGESITIGFSQRQLAGSEWYEQLIRVAQMEADHLGVKLIITDAQNNLSKQISDVENLISQGVDAVIMNPQHSTGILPAADSVHRAGIPLTVVNSGMDADGSPFTYVSTDVFDSGYDGGMALAKAYDEKFGWKDEVNAVVLSAGPQELESDRRRWGQISGYNDYMLEKYGKSNLNIISYQYYDWQPEKALNITQDLLQANDDIDIIFSACDGGVQGIIPALESAGKTGDIMITSIDGRKSVYEWIKDGDKGVIASVSNDPRTQGKWAVFFAAYAAKGASTPSTFYAPNPTVTLQNINDYYDPNSVY